MVALAHFGAGFSGKKSQAEYPAKPFLNGYSSESCAGEGELSEEEKQKAVDLFFAREKARRVNWKRSHRGKE